MQKMLMNPATGSVDTTKSWAAEGCSEEDGLVEVVANIEGQDGYDAEYGALRPA